MEPQFPEEAVEQIGAASLRIRPDPGLLWFSKDMTVAIGFLSVTINRLTTGDAMSRIAALQKRAKNKYGTGPMTQQQTDSLLDEYLTGVRQQQHGEVINTAIDEFLAAQNEDIRQGFEKSLEDLHKYSNFKRFRARAFMIVMTAFQNGSVDGVASRKPFGLFNLLEEATKTVKKKYKFE